jgi:very-short-patch-repair endonuclease
MDEERLRVSPVIRKLSRQLRRPLTPAELILWKHLRGSNVGGFKFRRQHAIGRFIADFYCAECRLIVEVDGDVHNDRKEYDTERTTWLNERDYHVLRLTNEQVLDSLEASLKFILEECRKRNSRNLF